MTSRINKNYEQLSREFFAGFWGDPKRRDILREGYCALKTRLDQSPQWFEEQTRFIVRLGRMVPDARTLDRFESGKGRHLNNPYHKSGLLIACSDLARKYNAVTGEAIEALLALAALLEDELSPQDRNLSTQPNIAGEGLVLAHPERSSMARQVAHLEPLPSTKHLTTNDEESLQSPALKEGVYPKAKLESIRQSIRTNISDNPEHPVFPPNSPRFPATPV